MVHAFFWTLIAIGSTVAAACNPLTTSLASSSYAIDFTQQKSLPSDWILADASNVTFGKNGAQFNFNKRKDAPYIWTNFYVAYGRIDVEMQVAAGTGVITSAVMFSDDADEIDWEFSGSNLGAGVSNGKAQTNVFAKGITGNYDRGTLQACSPPPQTSFHIYSINWTPDRIDWIIDGKTLYTTTNNGQNTGNYQFPQTPSRLHIGIWDAGDPDTAAGTRAWAGGLTDYTKGPYIAYVKNVKISTPYPCKSWKYPDNFSGKWSDVKCTNEALPSSASPSTTSSSTKPKSTAVTYTVVAGDNGWSIADNLGCTFDQLSAVNSGVNWDALNIGQQLRNPNGSGSVSSSSSISLTASKTATSNQSSSVTTKTSSSIGASSTPTTSKAASGSTASTSPATSSASWLVSGAGLVYPTSATSSASKASTSSSIKTSTTTKTSTSGAWSNWQNSWGPWKSGRSWKRGDKADRKQGTAQYGRNGGGRHHI